jgi:hypothetical protein
MRREAIPTRTRPYRSGLTFSLSGTGMAGLVARRVAISLLLCECGRENLTRSEHLPERPARDLGISASDAPRAARY